MTHKLLSHNVAVLVIYDPWHELWGYSDAMRASEAIVAHQNLQFVQLVSLL